MGLSRATRLGPYEIVAPLGAGGMGEVYQARDTRLDRTVAIKVLNSTLVASPNLRSRFEREAKTISQLNHPNICSLYDVGHEQGTDYLVMEFLQGESLEERLKRGPLPLKELISIGSDIDALERAHRAGIVHRDLKPGNVMLTKTGAKLLDFGLAKPGGSGAAGGSAAAPLLSAAMTVNSPSPQQSPLTQQGALVGTVQYMSPEQIQGLEADTRSDVFAFGAMLYEMATGKRPFNGKSQIKVASAILRRAAANQCRPEDVTACPGLAGTHLPRQESGRALTVRARREARVEVDIHGAGGHSLQSGKECTVDNLRCARRACDHRRFSAYDAFRGRAAFLRALHGLRPRRKNRAAGVRVSSRTSLEQQQHAAITSTHWAKARPVVQSFAGFERLKAEHSAIEFSGASRTLNV